MQNPFIVPVVKSHLKYSPSSLSRILKCHGSVGESESERDLSSNDAADEGQIGHDIFEACMKDGGSAERFIGRRMVPSDGANFVLEVDRHFARAVDLALAATRALLSPDATLMLEQSVALAGPLGSLCGGTADVFVMRRIILSTGAPGFRLDALDLKMGMLEVDAEANAQLLSYAVMFLDTYNLWGSVEIVGLTIMQPRQFFGEKIKRVDYPVSALADFRKILVDTITAIEGGSNQFLAGPHCRYCGRLGMCPASAAALNSLLVAVNTDPALLSAAALGWVVDMRKVFEQFTKRAEAILKDRALRGEDIGRPLVMTRKNRQWKDENAARAALLSDVGTDALDVPTPAQVADRFPALKARIGAPGDAFATFTPDGDITVGAVGDKRKPYTRPNPAAIWQIAP